MDTSADGKGAPTTVLLIRHGMTPTTGKELPGRAPGLGLAEAGVTQAKRVGEQLADLQEQAGDRPRRRIAAIYASPLERTQETASAIGDAVGVAVQPHEGLIELDIGDWTGMALDEAIKRPEWRYVQTSPSTFRFPGGESFFEMQTRIIGAVDQICADHPGETVVAVSHADPIRAFVGYAMGAHLDLFQRVMVSPCSVTAIAYSVAGPMVLTVNASDVTSMGL